MVMVGGLRGDVRGGSRPVGVFVRQAVYRRVVLMSR
jgi:hypothetical protein